FELEVTVGTVNTKCTQQLFFGQDVAGMSTARARRRPFALSCRAGAWVPVGKRSTPAVAHAQQNSLVFSFSFMGASGPPSAGRCATARRPPGERAPSFLAPTPPHSTRLASPTTPPAQPFSQTLWSGLL